MKSFAVILFVALAVCSVQSRHVRKNYDNDNSLSSDFDDYFDDSDDEDFEWMKNMSPEELTVISEFSKAMLLALADDEVTRQKITTVFNSHDSTFHSFEDYEKYWKAVGSELEDIKHQFLNKVSKRGIHALQKRYLS